ncbi:universal stress A, partial [Olea europaea subsp. europaea]
FSVETIIEAGDPKEAICEAVEKLKVELLVLGNHSQGALQRAFLRSISNYYVHNAKCQVLVVKKKA